MKIYIGADHAGAELKGKLIPFVKSLGHEVVDLDAVKHTPQDDYPDFIAPVAEAVSATTRNNADQTQNVAEEIRGIVIGSSGQGEAMVANRFSGVRAAEYYGGNLDIVKLSREHNDANVLSLGARFINEQDAKEAVELWLSTHFSGDSRHKRRIDEIDKSN